jgi:glutamate/tyrosine decarboxylase-like PLP-dependent enzyme
MASTRDRRPTAPASLDPTLEQIVAMAGAAVQAMQDYLRALPDLPIVSGASSEALKKELPQHLPVEGQDFRQLLELISQVVFPASRHNGHPRFFGYVASPGSAATALADLLASTLNPTVNAWRSAPGPTEIERLTIRWIKEAIGYSAEADGLFVSGGSMANFSALAAARAAKAPVAVTSLGCQALDRPMRIYMSEEAHYSNSKAAGLLGIGHDNVRAVGVNDRFKLDPQALKRQIREDIDRGYLPFCVVASAGTTNTGACDRIDELADVAREYGLWLHVDGCYGGFATLAPSRRALFRGLDRADSVALDPHKWLYVPVDCGCVLYRDPAEARRAFGHEAEYIRVFGHQADEAYVFWDYGPELTRRFRALKVWMMLSHVGIRALGEAIEANCRCAEYLAELVSQSADMEMLAPVELSIFCFRYMPEASKAAYAKADGHQQQVMDKELNAHNERILTEVQRGGSSYLSNANIAGRFALRGCVLNYRTTPKDMEILLEDVRRAAKSASD